MIKISLEVQKINYEKCFENLIAPLVKECESKKEPNEIEKFIARLGDDTVPLVEKLLSFLDVDARDQIIVWLLEDQQEMIIKSVNEAIHNALGVDAFKIGALYAQDRPGTKIAIHAAQIKMDSKQLAESPALTGLVGGAAKLAFSLTESETIEKEGVKLLSSEYINPKLVSMLADGLHEAGLDISIRDIVIAEDSGKYEIPHLRDPEKDEGLLPDAIEDKLINAFVSWLKEIL